MILGSLHWYLVWGTPHTMVTVECINPEKWMDEVEHWWILWVDWCQQCLFGKNIKRPGPAYHVIHHSLPSGLLLVECCRGGVRQVENNIYDWCPQFWAMPICLNCPHQWFLKQIIPNIRAIWSSLWRNVCCWYIQLYMYMFHIYIYIFGFWWEDTCIKIDIVYIYTHAEHHITLHDAM